MGGIEPPIPEYETGVLPLLLHQHEWCSQEESNLYQIRTKDPCYHYHYESIKLVRLGGNDPPASAMSKQRSTSELKAHWWPSRSCDNLSAVGAYTTIHCRRPSSEPSVSKTDVLV